MSARFFGLIESCDESFKKNYENAQRSYDNSNSGMVITPIVGGLITMVAGGIQTALTSSGVLTDKQELVLNIVEVVVPALSLAITSICKYYKNRADNEVKRLEEDGKILGFFINPIKSKEELIAEGTPPVELKIE